MYNIKITTHTISEVMYMEYLIATILLLALIRNLKSKENVDYKKYLQSRHWQRVRKKTLKRFGYKCALCSNTKNLQVHHNTYKHLGHEKKLDVIVLCDFHHKMVHNKLKR